MSGRPNSFMPMYWADYWADTPHLTGAQHGAYLNLIGRYWRLGGPLPDDDGLLWRIAMADSRKAWDAMRPVIAAFFHIADGLWRHKRIDAELLHADQRYTKRSNAAAARWGKQMQSTSNGHAMHHAMHEQPQPQPHIPPLPPKSEPGGAGDLTAAPPASAVRIPRIKSMPKPSLNDRDLDQRKARAIGDMAELLPTERPLSPSEMAALKAREDA